MKIGAVMKREVVSIQADEPLEAAIQRMVERRVGMLPVVDEQDRLVGILGLRQILKLLWPSFIDMVEDYDFVHNFGALERGEISPEQRASPVSTLMEPPVSVEAVCGLLRAEAVMRQHRLRDLPVVDEQNRLVGLASWVDVGVAFLRQQEESL